MQCKNCERDKTAKLTDGKQVCTYCPEWLLECEAKELLRLPLDRRRLALQRRTEKGRNINELKKRLEHIHRARKAARGS